MSKKLRWMVKHNEDLPLVKLHDPLITWFYEVIWKI